MKEGLATGDSGRSEGNDTVPEPFPTMQYAGAPIVTYCSCAHSYSTLLRHCTKSPSILFILGVGAGSFGKAGIAIPTLLKEGTVEFIPIIDRQKGIKQAKNL